MAENQKGAKIEKTQQEHPGEKVKIIDTHERVEVKATEKHQFPGTIRKVHPVTAKAMIKNGTAVAIKEQKQ